VHDDWARGSNGKDGKSVFTKKLSTNSISNKESKAFQRVKENIIRQKQELVNSKTHEVSENIIKRFSKGTAGSHIGTGTSSKGDRSTLVKENSNNKTRTLKTGSLHTKKTKSTIGNVSPETRRFSKEMRSTGLSSKKKDQHAEQFTTTTDR
jgi:hypothetical protein